MELKDGFILNFKYDNPVSNSIGSIMAHYWTHTGIVVKVQGDDIYILEAMGTYREEKYQKEGFNAFLRFFARIKEFFGGKVIVSKYSKSFLENLHSQNRLKIMDFKVPSSDKFAELVTKYKDTPYDYFGALSIGWKRIMKFLGRDYSNDKNTLNKLFCSELAARFLDETTDFDLFKLGNKASFEEFSPQDVSLIYDKLKYLSML